MDNKKHRSTEKQIDFLVDYMLQNKEFASGKFLSIQGKKKQNSMWEKLTEELNELGPRKTTEQWKKVWKNQKLLTRKKNSEIKSEQKKTGNICVLSELSEKEKKILAVIGTTSSEGLGFSEGSVAYDSANTDDLSNVPNIDDSSKEEHIEVIICDSENNSFANSIDDVEELTNLFSFNRNESNNFIEIENECNKNNERGSTENKKVSSAAKEKENKPLQERKRKYTDWHKVENELLENLVVGNNEGMSKISRALEALAESNNNIANSIDKLTAVLAEKRDK